MDGDPCPLGVCGVPQDASISPGLLRLPGLTAVVTCQCWVIADVMLWLLHGATPSVSAVSIVSVACCWRSRQYLGQSQLVWVTTNTLSCLPGKLLGTEPELQEVRPNYNWHHCKTCSVAEANAETDSCMGELKTL